MLEAKVLKEARAQRERKQAPDMEGFGGFDAGFEQFSAQAFSVEFFFDRQRFDFRQVIPRDVKRAGADQLLIGFGDVELLEVFINFGDRTRQKLAFIGEVTEEAVHGFDVLHACFAD